MKNYLEDIFILFVLIVLCGFLGCKSVELINFIF